MFPISIVNQYGNIVLPAQNEIKRLAVSSNYSSVVLQYTTGEAYALGTNTSGKYGTGDTTAITGDWRILRSDVRLFTASHNYSILISNTGTVFGSGNITSIFPSAQGYTFSDSTVYQDITSAFSSFNIKGIKSLISFGDSGNRLYLIDENDQLWGIGTDQYYSLGSGTNTLVNWTSLTNGSNVKSVHPGLYVTWIIKNDGTVWRCGTNSYGTLADSSSSRVYNTFTQFTTYQVKDLSMTAYNLSLLLQDGTLRLYGISSNGQLGNSSTSGGTFLTPYTPSSATVGTVQGLMESETSLYTTMIKGGKTLMGTGDNTSGKLGTGVTTNPTTTFTSTSTGVLTLHDYVSIKNLTGVSNASYYVWDNEVYSVGAAAMTLLPSVQYTWALMNTPKSVLKTSETALSGTWTNISTTNPTMTRYSHSYCPYGSSKFIVYGGYNGSTIFSDVNIYDANTATWSTIPNPLGVARFGAGISVIGDTLYIFGGNSTTSGTVNDFYSVDLTTSTWTQITSTSVPSARSHNRMCAVGNRLYNWGGENGSDLHMYNPSTNTWTQLTSSPVTNNIAGDMCTDGVDLYISNAASFYKYDISTGLWSLLSSKPSTTQTRLTYCNGFIYAHGNAALYVYRVKSNLWVTSVSGGVNTQREGLSSANGLVYQHGGLASSNTSNFYKVQ